MSVWATQFKFGVIFFFIFGSRVQGKRVNLEGMGIRCDWGALYGVKRSTKICTIGLSSDIEKMKFCHIYKHIYKYVCVFIYIIYVYIYMRLCVCVFALLSDRIQGMI